MDWDDAEEIGRVLFNTFPDIDPLTIEFAELRRLVLDLDDFEGDPRASNETRLEAIRMAWLEEYETG
jgi:FeS assembly protein IscX